MASKTYKQHKRGAGSFVQLAEWIMATEAWATLPPGPRALYIELKRRYNGHNNGEIYLSHRDAAKALNVHRNTVGAWFKEVEKRGFTVKTREAHLGPVGVGIAATWALTELSTKDGKKATNSFKKWKTPAQIPCNAVTNTVRAHQGSNDHAQ